MDVSIEAAPHRLKVRPSNPKTSEQRPARCTAGTRLVIFCVGFYQVISKSHPVKWDAELEARNRGIAMRRGEADKKWKSKESTSISDQCMHVCAAIFVAVVQSLSRIWLLATPLTATHQASLSFTIYMHHPSAVYYMHRHCAVLSC